jgi:arylsulfatase A
MLFLLLASFSLGSAQDPSPATTPPNLVVILADDLGWGDPGCYGTDSRVPTPNMDRLAREGLRFTDAHSPSAVCTPTRYGLLTGRYAWRSRLKKGVLGGTSANLIDIERLTIADVLRSAGYRTACVGKWHLGLGPEGQETDYTRPLRPGPLDHGFDTSLVIPASLDMAPYLWVLDDRPLQPATEKTEKSGHRRQGGGGFWRAGAIAPDFRFVEVLPRIASRAEELIERYAREEADRPFFLYLPLPAPHTPWMPSAAFEGATAIGHYGDFVAQVDHVVGRVLAALELTGKAGETIVVVTSDNGSHWPLEDVERHGHDANGGWRGQKADIHEGGHRVPLLVRGPGVPVGGVRDELVCLTDLLATAAAVADIDLPADAGEDSFDLSPLLFADSAGEFERADCIHHSLSGHFAIRRGDWKLIERRGSGGFTAPRVVEAVDGEPAGELYHLGDDPGETLNLWLERPEVVAELTALLERRREGGHSRDSD